MLNTYTYTVYEIWVARVARVASILNTYVYTVYEIWVARVARYTKYLYVHGI